MITSGSYHPQLHGKVECSHREFRKKFYYDMVHLKSKGANWVENIPNYIRVLNELAREELGWRSPFEIYYGRISNFVSRFNLEYNSSIYQEDINFNFPEDLTIQKLLDHAKKIRNRSEQCGKHIDDRPIAKYKKKYKSVVFKKDEKVLVRLKSKGGKGAPKRHFVVEGKVIKNVKQLKSIRYH